MSTYLEQFMKAQRMQMKIGYGFHIWSKVLNLERPKGKSQFYFDWIKDNATSFRQDYERNSLNRKTQGDIIMKSIGGFPARIKSAISLFVLVLGVILACRGGASGLGVSQKQPASGKPAIEFTKIPPYNSFEDLEGRVHDADYEIYCVAVYIYVSGWWTKPYWISPKTRIRKDSTWKCDVTTGGTDEKATRFVAFLIPKDYDPPLMRGEIELPDAIYRNSVARVDITRDRR